MKFPHNRSLKELALYTLAAMFLIFLVEFFVIRYKIEVLEEIEEKKDFARSIQLDGQEIAYLIELGGKNGVDPNLIARINDHEHLLEILSNGGRIPNTEVFLSSLSSLPQVTFKELHENWKTYKESVIEFSNASDSFQAESITIATDSIADSLATASPQVNPKQISTVELTGQWLTVSKWYNRLLADLTEEAEEKKNAAESWVLLIVAFDIVLVASLFYFFYSFVILPLRKLKDNIHKMHQDETFAANEIGNLASDVNDVLEQLSDATEFVSAIGEGKLDFDYKTLDENYQAGKNKLADSLISMQGKLKSLNLEEQRRQWANEGLAKFVDILRSSNDNIQVLADKIISALVKYTNSNQGGLYTLNDEDEKNKHLELVSLFAFDSKKYDKRKIRLGEGILGQTFLEKETTLLTEIPEEYVRITSGLGDANPRSILIVPLKVDKDVYGIVELASFKEYQAHEIAFVEKLAETIASTLASVKVSQKNLHLIEQFQQQAEEMHAQEEEMRQNMEELQATQEELARKEQDYILRIKELEQNQADGKVSAELQALKQQLLNKEQEHQEKLKVLEDKLRQIPEHSDEWALVKELETTFRIQLEALKMAQTS